MLLVYFPIGMPETHDAHIVALQSRTKGPLPSCLRNYSVRPNSIAPKYNILLVSISRPAELEDLLQCLGSDWEEVPIRRQGDVVEVPTGEIFVKFKTNTRMESIKDLFRQLQLEVLQSPQGPSLTFKVSNHPLSGKASLETVQQLAKHTCIIYATPNWLVVRPSRSPL